MRLNKPKHCCRPNNQDSTLTRLGLRGFGRVSLVICCLFQTVAFIAGCSSGSKSGGIAGYAYVEDEDGNLISVENNHAQGTSSGPIRPTEGAEDWLTEFELTERSGRLVSSQELKGQPYVVSFFFTTCPTICKQQNEKVRQLQSQFKGNPIRLVSITCDPEVDNPEVLSIYADQFGADPQQWLFLTGEMDYIRRVGTEMFFLAVNRRFHADKFLLIDKDGNIYRTYEWTDDNAWTTLQEDIRTMLRAGGRLPTT